MNNFSPGSSTLAISSPPNLESPLIARSTNVQTTPLEATMPVNVVAISANWDTDFRKKIGIERWGWGLNE